MYMQENNGLSEGHGPRLTALCISFSLLTAAFFIASYLKRCRKPQAPLLFAELSNKARAQKLTTDAATVMGQVYAMLKNGTPMVRITTEDGEEEVIVNHKFFNEIKNLPDNTLNIVEGINFATAGDYSHVQILSPIGQTAIRSDLTPGLPRLAPILSEESDLALGRVLPQSQNPTAVSVYPSVLSIIAQITSRVFVGKDLGRNPRWQELSHQYSTQAFEASHAIKLWKPWLRPLVYRFLPEIRKLNSLYSEAVELLKKDAMSNVKRDEDILTNWVAAKLPGWSTNYELQASIQMEIAMAAIHTSSMALAHLIFDLAAYPEYVQPLRDEINEVLLEAGGFTKESMAKLKKMDSFMKESQCRNPPALTTFKRKALKGFTLSDGTFIPKGTILEVDGSHRYWDLELYENADHFDGFRFYRLREQLNEPNKHQFVSSSNEYLHWGLGRHACPGRFFAGNEIKSVLAKILLSYDIYLPKGATRRPKNIVFSTQVSF